MKFKIIGLSILYLCAFLYNVLLAIYFNGYYFHDNPTFLSLIILSLLNICCLIGCVGLPLFMFKDSKFKYIPSLAIIVVFLVSVIVVPYNVTIKSFERKVNYTKEKWSVVEEKYKYYMAKDFLKDYEIIGLDEDDIISYLGDSSIKSIEDSKTILRYNCGFPVRKFATDPYILSITLESNHVISYSLHEG